MSRADNLLQNLVNFVDEEFCEATDEQDCNNCTHYDVGHCPVLLAKQYLLDEGYSDDE